MSKHALLIHAHPEPRSFVTAMRDTIAGELERAGTVVAHSDLYAMGYNPVLSRADFPVDQGEDPLVIALAQRLILAMRRSGVQIPEAGPEALWTLAIAVAGWWLTGRDPEIEAELRPFAALPMLLSIFNGVKALPGFAAAASRAEDEAGLQSGGQRFAAVVSELGIAKLKAALQNGIFIRLQQQIVASYPLPGSLFASQVAPGRVVRRNQPAVEGKRLTEAEGAPISTTPTLPPVSEETVAFLSKRYSEDLLKRILKA